MNKIERILSEIPDFEAKVTAAQSSFDRELFRHLLTEMVNIPSPTGEEKTIADFCAGFMSQHGLKGEVQDISEKQANALGRLPSKTKDGPSLLLYGGLDTHMGVGDDHWAGVPYPEILRPKAVWNGDEVAGLSAENPKGFAACVIMAGVCLAKSGVELRGDVTVGLGAGGMTTLTRPGWPSKYIGHGIGATFMLQRGIRPDYCILCKPRYVVSWEEVGICFFKVIVKGGVGYAGVRHVMPADPNPIPKTAKVIEALEAWFPLYSKRHAKRALNPQGAISAIHGGWDYSPIISTGRVELLVDIRCTPDTDPAQVQRELQACLNEISMQHPEIQTELELALAIPGSITPKENWIVQSMIKAWEASEQRPHTDVQNFSGYTDISIIRNAGIPAARLGVPVRQRPADPTDSMPMNRMHIDDAEKLVKVLVRSAIDTCGRSYEETCQYRS